jgi:Sulfatase-modifying factor enzyme 1
MGCEIGRDDEKPLHRVWVDAFELAAYQVTNEEYACFLASMSFPQPLCWNDSNFNHPKMPVVSISWHEAMGYCEWLSRATSKLYRLPSEAEWERAARGDAERSLTRHLSRFPITPSVGRAGLSRWVCIRQTFTGFTIWATTCMSGVRIGTTPATTAGLPNEIRKGLQTPAGAPREVARGGTRSRSPALRRDRVFRQSSNTPTTVSESRDPRPPEAVSRPTSKASLPNA